MIELFNESFLLVNAGFSALFMMVMLYWLAVIAGVIGTDFLDFDFDGDIDSPDLDVDVDVVNSDMVKTLLGFFYVGKVPLMIIISILVLNMWALALLGNYYLNPGRGLLIGSALALGNIFVSLMLSKVLLMPFVGIFSAFNKDANAPQKIVGRICVIITSQVSAKMGQAEVRLSGAPILLNVKTEDGSVLHKGDQAIVVGHNDDRTIYFVMPVEEI